MSEARAVEILGYVSIFFGQCLAALPARLPSVNATGESVLWSESTFFDEHADFEIIGTCDDNPFVVSKLLGHWLLKAA